MMIESFGISIPRYQSSSLTRCGKQSGAPNPGYHLNSASVQGKTHIGRIRKLSLMIQLIYGSFGKSDQLGILDS